MPDTLDHVHHTRQVYDMTTLGRALARAVNEPAARDLLHLGTAAIWDVPAAGNASTSQVVIGTDTRLTDARTPTAHADSHAGGGSDVITNLGYCFFGDSLRLTSSGGTGYVQGFNGSDYTPLRLMGTTVTIDLSAGACIFAGTAPSSVSSGQVAIGGGDGLFAGQIKTTSTADGAITTAGKITAKAAVPASFADLAAVRTYLASILT